MCDSIRGSVEFRIRVGDRIANNVSFGVMATVRVIAAFRWALWRR